MNIIELENVNKYFGENHILKDISLKIDKGEIVSIIGSSGSGKTTLLRCIKGLVPCDSGTINVNIKTGDIAQKVGIVFQNYNLFEHLTIMENLTLAPIKLLKQKKEVAQDNAIKLLKLVGLEDKANAIPNELSGGQKQRVAIARILAMEPEIILFDEPTSALDPVMTKEVLSIIYKLAKKNITMIIVTHEMNFAKAVSDRIVYMENGEIIEDGSVKQVFSNPKNEKTKKFLELESWESYKNI